jgi:hypothetical protein
MSTSTCLSILVICLFCAISANKQGTFLNDADFARARLLVKSKSDRGSPVPQKMYSADKFEGFIVDNWNEIKLLRRHCWRTTISEPKCIN